MLVKLPLMIAPLLLAYFLYRLAKGCRSNSTLLTLTEASARFFSAYITALWGQLNAISALSVLLALYFARKGMIRASALSLGVWIATKLYPLVVLTFFLMREKSRSGWGGVALYIAFSLLPTASATAITFGLFRWRPEPFLSTIYSQPFSLLCESCAGPRPLANVLSLIWLLNRGLVYSFAAQLIWIPLWLLTAYWVRRDASVKSLLSLYLAVLALFPRVSEQFILDLLPLMLLKAYEGGDGFVSKIGAIALSILGLAFSLVNFGLEILSPAFFDAKRLEGIRSLYASNIDAVNNLMGGLGALTTIVSIAMLVKTIPKGRWHPSQDFKEPIAGVEGLT